MKLFSFLLLFIFSAAPCLSQTMTMEEIKKAEWRTLDKGIDYINVSNTMTTSDDSIKFSIIGVINKGDTLLFSNYIEHNEMKANLESIFVSTFNSNLISVLNKKLTTSKHGYLKLDMSQIFTDSVKAIIIFLQDAYDSNRSKRDIASIRKITGVVNVQYTSKEMAKQMFLSDGNNDWDKVLSENPLPSSFEVNLDTFITEELYEKFRNEIFKIIPEKNISDISYSKGLFSKGEFFCIVEYDRH